MKIRASEGNLAKSRLSSGAICIPALRRPDPLPRLFGYHEVFHLLVIVAGVCHFAAVTSVVATPPVA